MAWAQKLMETAGVPVPRRLLCIACFQQLLLLVPAFTVGLTAPTVAITTAVRRAIRACNVGWLVMGRRLGMGIVGCAGPHS